MRKIKVILVIVFIAVAALFIANEVNERFLTSDHAPVLSCPEGVLEVSVSDGEEAFLADVTASDEEDGDLTDDIVIGGVSKLITADTARVTFYVFDKDANMASCTRMIRYTDYERPKFTLSEPLVYKLGETVSLGTRLTASDVIDGDLTDAIRISAVDVSTQVTGTYSVTVQVTNSMGDTARLELPLMIVEDGEGRAVELREELVYIGVGTDFDPLSYIAESVDTASVLYASEVDTDVAGTYYVTYTSADSGIGSVLTVVVE